MVPRTPFRSGMAGASLRGVVVATAFLSLLSVGAAATKSAMEDDDASAARKMEELAGTRITASSSVYGLVWGDLVKR